MAIKLTISILVLVYFGALKCAEAVKINLPKTGEEICDDGFEHFNGNCYKLIENKGTFVDSKAYCEANFEGDLVSVHDKETNQFLLYMVRPGSAFLGLELGSTNFTWTTAGEEYDYANYPPGYEPFSLKGVLGECVMLRGEDGLWVNYQCTNTTVPYICQKSTNEISTEVPPTVLPPNVCPPSSWYMKPQVPLYSPGYPYHYEGDNVPLNCNYTLVAVTPNKKIKIDFTELSSCGTGNSVISIYAGQNDQGALIKKLTGDVYKLPIPIPTEENVLFIRFTSNGHGKWSASWTEV